MEKYQAVIDHIRSSYGVEHGFIPLHAPVFRGNEKKYLEACIDSTFVSSVGEFVDQFEDMVASYTGAKQAVVCVNGTNALQMALLLVGVMPGEEVITQALTFVATGNAISYCNATPIFLDVDKDTLGLSPLAVRTWLEDNANVNGDACYNKVTGKRIRACVPMHTFGHPIHLDEMLKLCEEYHLELVEDAAESLGSFYKGQHTGTFGKVGVLSFNGNKTITTGGGGMLLFNDEALAHQAKHLTTQAKLPHKWAFVHDAIGYNYRMPNINAALGCAQMEQLDEILAYKRNLSTAYKTYFEELEDVFFVNEPEHCSSNYWLNALILKNSQERDEFLQELNDDGIMTRPVWQLLSDLPMFCEAQRDSLSNSTWLEQRLVNIPSGVM